MHVPFYLSLGPIKSNLQSLTTSRNTIYYREPNDLSSLFNIILLMYFTKENKKPLPYKDKFNFTVHAKNY